MAAFGSGCCRNLVVNLRSVAMQQFAETVSGGRRGAAFQH